MSLQVGDFELRDLRERVGDAGIGDNKVYVINILGSKLRNGLKRVWLDWSVDLDNEETATWAFR